MSSLKLEQDEHIDLDPDPGVHIKNEPLSLLRMAVMNPEEIMNFVIPLDLSLHTRTDRTASINSKASSLISVTDF